MKKLLVSLAITVVLALSFATFYLLKTSTPARVPDINISTIDGNKINLSELKGKPLLVTFWSTTCSTCIKEMPHLISLYDELRHQGLELIGISMPYDPPNRVLEISAARNITYPLALDIDGTIAEAFGDIQVTPTSFLIDTEGNIIKQQSGELNLKILKSKIKKLLRTRPNSVS